MNDDNAILIGLDAGTSVIKAVAFDSDGHALGQAAQPNRIEHVAGGGVEQDMTRTWITTAQVLRELSEQIPHLATRVAALSITGQGDGTWLIDAAGEPVAPAWLWLDGRSGGIVDELRGNGIGERIYRITGTGLNPSIQNGQMKWLKHNRPEILRRAATVFHCKDWLYFKCCGERATDLSEGVFTYGDYRTRRYSDEVLELLELGEYRHLLPELVDAGRQHGKLTAAAAAATGLPQGLPVVLAPVDILCTGLGGGLYEPQRNVGFTILGSTGIHMRVYHALDDIRLHDQAGYIMPFIAPGSWAGVMSNMAATLNIDWLVDALGRLLGDFGIDMPRRELLQQLDHKAGAAAPGKVLYHPFIFESGERGPFINPRARAQFLGLTTQTDLYDLMRAIYDSLGLAARDCYESLGHRPEEIRAGGGAMRSATIRKILAGALNTPLQLVEQDEAGAAGAAMTACLALGHDHDVGSVCRRWVTPKFSAREQPDTALSAIYDELLPIYRSGYRRMDAFWRELDAMRKRHEGETPR
jgi:erythritol kinase